MQHGVVELFALYYVQEGRETKRNFPSAGAIAAAAGDAQTQAQKSV
jgi:hypothetical protein